jgi:hypothetical protein
MIAKKKTADHLNRRKTRIEPPALEEAIVAAQGLSDDIESQTEIAAQLMGIPIQDVRPAILQAAAQARAAPSVAAPVRANGTKVVVVERRRSRLVSR